MKLQTFRGYIVDYRMRQFRSQPANFGIIQFIPFGGKKGQRLLSAMLEQQLVPDEMMTYCN